MQQRATNLINGFSELKCETRFLTNGINHTRNEKAKRRFNRGI